MNKEANAMGSVRVAIVGVGNCASSLVQGVEYYKNADPNDRVPGLMHVTFGDYHVSDVKFVAAFDVDAKKVGMDLSEAIVASENNTITLTDVPPTGVTVQRGPTFDGLGTYYREIIEESSVEAVDVVQALRDAQVDVVVSYLPVGSEQADKFYAQAAIDAGCAFVNALPVFIASDPSSPTPACRSSATTSRARSVRRSCTARWPSCSRTAVSSCCARTSSTSAATWTS
jgi:myo-inositol-1-phosphate synthase